MIANEGFDELRTEEAYQEWRSCIFKIDSFGCQWAQAILGTEGETTNNPTS